MSKISLFALFVSLFPLISTFPLTVHPPNSSSLGNSSPKFVFAHHIIGNTYNYTPSTWSSDITLAIASGIDGFALNIGNQPWQLQQIQCAYEAASRSATGFKMFLSLDMSALPCDSISDAQALISIVRAQASHFSQFRFGPDNKTFVSTFSGEQCTFSAASPSAGWAQHFVAPLSSEIHFVPSFFVDPARLKTGDSLGKGGFGGIVNGDFNWNSGWPIQVTTIALAKLASNPAALASLLNLNVSILSSTPSTSLSHGLTREGRDLAELLSSLNSPGEMSDAARAAFAGIAGTFKSDEQHLMALHGGNLGGVGGKGPGGAENALSSLQKTYMAAVSPWFFTHYSPQSWNKNFMFLGDNHLYSRRWETLVAARDAVDLVEIVTWNDYGESHYIGPIEGIQPNSQAWVNGNSHTGWLELTAYYAKAFKSGVYPKIKRDKIVMWARTHPRDAQASQDAVGRPTNFQLTEDSLWATVFVPSPSTVILDTSPDNNDTASLYSAPTAANAALQTFQVPAGVSHLKAPLIAGSRMRASVFRNGKMVLDFAPAGYKFNTNPETYNFNAFVAASP